MYIKYLMFSKLQPSAKPFIAMVRSNITSTSCFTAIHISCDASQTSLSLAMIAIGRRGGSKLVLRTGETSSIKRAVTSNRRRWSVSTILTPPLVFTGLLLSLWTYKCLMMVVFQNKIIYMPSIPPFSRRERIEDYEAQCKPVRWQEKRIKAADGVDIALALASLNGSQEESSKGAAHVVIVYFQGSVTITAIL